MIDVRFYNTLTHEIETFSAVRPPEVAMYNCGPTVYDYAHIGNFRAFVFADVVRRFLELVGYRVDQVMNITDVGHMTDDAVADGGGQDKMQLAMDRMKTAKKAGQIPQDAVADPGDPRHIAAYFTQAFLEDAIALRLKIAAEYPAKMPRATEHIAQMQDLITKLLDRQHAYVASDGAVYFSVQSYPEYGRLSGNTIEKLQGGGGGRVIEQHQAQKRHPADFLLWKPDASHVMKWDSPWGEGYPGWHIECSAMAMARLSRSTLDIHTGGEDNIFPHHECEIAQSSGATGQSFARFWLHTRFLLVEGRKMSKSSGNFYTVRDVLSGRVTGRPVDAAALRFELIKAHYRSNMNFTVRGLEDSARSVQRLRNLRDELEQQADGQSDQVDLSHPAVASFAEALGDDLNMSRALAVVFKWMDQPTESPPIRLAVLRMFDQVLDVLGLSSVQAADQGQIATDQEAVQQQCHLIDAARVEKDFATADRIRQALIDQGYDVSTTKSGTVATKRLA